MKTNCKHIIFLFLFFLTGTFAFSQNADQSRIIQIIQQGNENLILSGQVDVNSSIRLAQYGNQNSIFTNNSSNLNLSQYGDKNFIGVQNYLPESENTLTIEQEGTENKINSFGTNSIIENAIISQSGTQLEMTIINE